MYCKHCGKEIADDSIFCPICGVRQKECYCHNCGKEIPSGASFCPYCGTRQKGITFNSISHVVNKFVSSIKTNTEPEVNEETDISPVKEDAVTITETKEEVQNEAIDCNSDLKECHFIEKESLSDESLGYWPQNNTIGTKNRETKDEDITINNDSELNNKDELNCIYTAMPILPRESLGYCPQNNKNSTKNNEAKDEDNAIEIDSEQNNENELSYIYSAMPLLPRFFGSLIDKFLIVALFVLVNIAIHPYKSAGDLGIYLSMLGANPANYEYIDRANINGSTGITNLYGAPPYIGQTSDFDIKMTSFFVVIYLLYYFVLEILFNSSLGKKFLGGHLLKRNSKKIQQRHILIRALIRSVLLFTTIWSCHFVIGLSYYQIFVILLLIIDVPVFICHRSTIDICSGTCYMERGEIITASMQTSNEYVEDSNTVSCEQIITEEDKENGNEIENNNDINEEYTTQTHSPIKKTLFFLAGLLFLCLLFGASWYYWPMITKKILDTTSRKEYILCPELVNVAKRINDNAPMKDTNGYTVISATYKDDLFIYRFIVDDSLELYSKIAKHLPEFKENLIIGIQLSTGEERDRYYDFAEYGVTIKSIFECKVSKETYSFSVSPEEISDALNTDITPYDRIKHLTKTQQKGLPSAIMEGVIVQEITIEEDHIYMKIGIDESDIDFEMLTNNKNEFGEDWIGWFSEQNKFYLSLVADADMGVYFYFYGMVTHYNMTIELSPKEVKLLTLK